MDGGTIVSLREHGFKTTPSGFRAMKNTPLDGARHSLY
jgi:hypothetical protein